MIPALILALLIAAPAQAPARQRQATVVGQILSSGGAPAAGTRVGAMDTSDPDAPNLVGVGQTDAGGRFRIEDLPPGRYYVFAGPLDAPTYYPGTTEISKASVVTLGAGSIVDTVNFALARATEGFTVSGRVIFHGDGPSGAEGPAAAALTRSDGLGPAGIVKLEADGTFTFRNVRPGTYEFFTNVGHFRPTTVTVLEQDVTAFEVVIVRIVDVYGIFTTEDGSAIPQFGIFFGGSALGQDAAEHVDVDRTFMLQLPEGDFRLAADLPSGYYFKSLTAGSTDLTRTPLKLTATDSRIRIVGVLAKTTPVRVTGRLVGSWRKDLPLTVELGEGLLQPKSARVRPDGTFELPDVMRGLYRAALVLESGLRFPGPPVAVAHEDVSGIEIPIPVLRDIVIRVSVEGGLMPRFSQLVFSKNLDVNMMGNLDPQSLQASRLFAGRTRSPMDPRPQNDPVVTVNISQPMQDGTWRVTLPDGAYQVGMLTGSFGGRGQPIHEVKEMSYDGANLLIEPMKVARDSLELRVTLAPNPRVPRFKVSGKVLGLDLESPPTTATLDGGAIGAIAALDSALVAGGAFEFDRVPPGVYTVRVNSKNPFVQGAMVQVSNRDVTGVTIRIPRLQEIRGHIEVRGNARPAGFVLVLESDSVADSVGALAIAVNPRPDGTFSIKAPEGLFHATVNGLPGGYTANLVFGGKSVIDASMTIGADNPELNVTLGVSQPESGNVVGKLTGATAAEFTQISLTGIGSVITLEAPIANGKFEFSAVPMGVYLVFLARNGESFLAAPALLAVTSKNQTGIEMGIGAAWVPGAKVDSPAREANEQAAIANLMTINTAEVTLLSATGGEYGSIAALVENGLLPSVFNSIVSGYLYSISAEGGDYVAVAFPANSAAGRHAFFSTPDGVVRYSVFQPLAPPARAGEPVE